MSGHPRCLGQPTLNRTQLGCSNVAPSAAGVVTRRDVRRIVMMMTFRRHDLLPVAVALLAALAVLFVSSASVAAGTPAGHETMSMMSMSMGGEDAPCEQEMEKASCQTACLIFCQASFRRSLVRPLPASTSPFTIRRSIRETRTSPLKRTIRHHEPDPVSKNDFIQSN